MASVDDRIVRMEFDNASFEKKISTTLASLGQLDKALKFTGAAKGLNDVSQAADKVSFGGISAGIEDVSKKFIALSTIGITVLSDITRRAAAAGEQIIKAFTIQPIIEGFHEYETQLNSVQTILANTFSKGTTLDQVNAALNQLNIYSDQTIYNFGQMAKNIGTFTAAGVDLDTSVQSIKGIANLAAMSGSSADQAANAMYQLSQAIATGSLKLIDWNSVVNAGMGGEAFKSALFETGKAMHTLTDVPMSQTFKEWEDSGHSFRETLQDGWITAGVLTTTLAGFTGDLTQQMLVSKGFSEDVAARIVKTAAIAKAAATEVKTFSQLVGTVKEAVGTGWADSFAIIIGNFGEAKTLWTGVNNAIGAFVAKNADARNALLQGWKDLGGRTLLINSLRDAFKNLSEVLAPIREAFSTIFPPLTAARLLQMTQAFARFTAMLKPSEDAVRKIKIIFEGFFATISIGWEIIKQGTKFLAGLAKAFLGLAAPGVTGFLVRLSQDLVKLQASLVKGGGIADFFANLASRLQKPLDLLVKFKDAIANLFDNFDDNAANKLGDSMGRLGDRFDTLKDIFAKVKDAFSTFGDWLKSFWQKLSDAMSSGDFNNILDLINVGLLGGIALLIRKLVKGGLKVDFTGGLIDKIGASFTQLTGVLKAMQLNLKANALLKIAAAIAILTASVVVLSLIDSAALTRALSAMAVGFGELMAAFAILTKLSMGPKSAASFGIISGGLILLAGAILLLSLAVRSIATMNWSELARGLTGITVMLGVLVVVTKPLAANSKGMVVAGVGITAMAIALTILAGAVKLFSLMSWADMAKGLVGVTIALSAIALAMNLMPSGSFMALQGIGLIAVATAMSILAGVILIFGKMDWTSMAKGFVGVAAGLLIIAAALNLMPITTPILAAGLVLVGIALLEISGALKIFATMSWTEIARGLVALGGALLIIAVAMYAMQSAIPGAIALTIVAVALGTLAAVLKVFGTIKFGDLLKSLAAVSVSLGVLGVTAMLLEPAIPVMLGLGIALIALGAGFALIGGGAMLIAKALEILAKSGQAAAKTLKGTLQAIGEAIPALSKGVAKGILEMIQVFIDAAPLLAKGIGTLLNTVFDALMLLIPKLVIILDELITGVLLLLRIHGPEYIATGLFLITSLLKGIRDNIKEVVKIVADIITAFLDEMTKQIPRISQSLATTIETAFISTAEALGHVAGTILFGTGMAFINGFFDGLGISIGPVMTWFSELPGKIIDWIGNIANTLWQTGADIISGLWHGIQSVWSTVTDFFSGLPGEIWRSFTAPLHLLVDIGKDIMQGLWNGMKEVWNHITGWLDGLGDLIPFHKGPPSEDAKMLYKNGTLIMQGLHNGMMEEWDNVENWLDNIDVSKAFNQLANQLSNMDDFNPTITPVLDLTRVASDASKINDYIQTSQALSPSFSYNQARTIANDQNAQQAESPNKENAPGDIRFEQNIYAPTELSTSDIYKNTRNQIRIAKEELSIP